MCKSFMTVAIDEWFKIDNYNILLFNLFQDIKLHQFKE